MSGKSLLLYNLSNPDNPMELSFEPEYGTIVCHCWFGDSFLLIGFSRGQVVALSTHANEVTEEMWSKKVHPSSLYGISYSSVLKRAAAAGDSGVKIIDMQNNFEIEKTTSLVYESLRHGTRDLLFFENWFLRFNCTYTHLEYVFY